MERPALPMLPAAAALVVGIGLVVLTIAASQIDASNAADDLLDLTSPVVTGEEVAQMRADLDKASAVATALDEEGIPALATQSGQSPEQFAAQLQTEDPELAAALAEYPEAEALADMVVGNLEARLDQFESAEDLPGLGLSLNQATWGRVALALALIALGVIGLLRPSRRVAVSVLAIGALMVVVPLALGYPGKTSDTDELLDSLRPFSLEKVEAREQALATARTLFEGFQEEAAQLEQASPDLSAESIEEVGAILDRYEDLVDFSRELQPKLVEADEISATTGMWLTIAPGIALVIAGALALGLGTRPRD